MSHTTRLFRARAWRENDVVSVLKLVVLVRKTLSNDEHGGLGWQHNSLILWNLIHCHDENDAVVISPIQQGV
jgi:hypothetical protein